MADREAVIHFIGGAVGGTAGVGPSTSSGGSASGSSSTARNPLSPSASPATRPSSHYKHILANTSPNYALFRMHKSRESFAFYRSAQLQPPNPPNTVQHQQIRSMRTTIGRHFANIIKQEGFTALYKGLLPNLIGVAPAKAVYFYTYSTSKRYWNENEYLLPNSAFIHMVSAGSAGFVSSTVVNPIWLVKTRLQLHHGRMSIVNMIRRVYEKEGLRGFYRGVTASYAGISETVIQFVLYEHLRSLLLDYASSSDNNQDGDETRSKIDFLNFMIAGGTAKFVACVAAYPHEVVRTRLREEGSASRGFFRTLYQLYNEGGRAMYRGLSVQLMRTVPNTAITMGTYELVVYLLSAL